MEYEVPKKGDAMRPEHILMGPRTGRKFPTSTETGTRRREWMYVHRMSVQMSENETDRKLTFGLHLCFSVDLSV